MSYRTLISLLDVELIAFFLLGAVAVWVLRKRTITRREWVIALAAATAFTAFHTPAAGYLALRTLEWSVPRGETFSDDIPAIVVLGGGSRRSARAGDKPTLTEDSFFRCQHAARLHREFPSRIVVLSGGRVGGDSNDPPLAEVMKEFMLWQGIPESRLLLEDRATTTAENARFTAELLKAQGIDQVILVTEAHHMPRSEMCFRRQGIDVVASASTYRTDGFRWTVLNCLPHAGTTRNVQRAFHEWLGILWYRVRGRV